MALDDLRTFVAKEKAGARDRNRLSSSTPTCEAPSACSEDLRGGDDMADSSPGSSTRKTTGSTSGIHRNYYPDEAPDSGRKNSRR